MTSYNVTLAGGDMGSALHTVIVNVSRDKDSVYVSSNHFHYYSTYHFGRSDEGAIALVLGEHRINVFEVERVQN